MSLSNKNKRNYPMYDVCVTKGMNQIINITCDKVKGKNN